ncbi:MAG: SUMF1/EgtB/PvdO family nonheme iron enzyme, partial [Kiritimatiellia bacterium]
AGNVWEWCNASSGSGRGIRGGGWRDYAYHARCGYSLWLNPVHADYYSSSSYSYDVSPTRGCHPTYLTGGYPYTSPAGAFAANGYGLYDMAGNVWEWCNDSSGSYRRVRGGGWDSYAIHARCGSFWNHPFPAPDSYGFRSVCR